MSKALVCEEKMGCPVLSLPNFSSCLCAQHVPHTPSNPSAYLAQVILLSFSRPLYLSLSLPSACRGFGSTPGACASRWLDYAWITMVEVQSLGEAGGGGWTGVLHCLARSFDKYSSTEETQWHRQEWVNVQIGHRRKGDKTGKLLEQLLLELLLCTCKSHWAESAWCMVSKTILLFRTERMVQDLQRGTVSRTEAALPAGKHILLQPRYFIAKLVQTGIYEKR